MAETGLNPERLTTVPLWTARVSVAAMEELGAGPRGRRFVVPITGGSFEGDPAAEVFGPVPSGLVRAGGFDLQWLRPDGVKELEALYHVETGDGVVLEIRNRVLLDYDAAGALSYGRSRIEVVAPEGRYDWLNRRMIVGSLQGDPEHRQAVIRAWVLC